MRNTKKFFDMKDKDTKDMEEQTAHRINGGYRGILKN